MEYITITWNKVHLYVEHFCFTVNHLCSGLEPWQLIVLTVVATLWVVWFWNVLFQPDASLSERTKKCFFSFVRRLPFVRGKIRSEMKKQEIEMQKLFQETTKNEKYIVQLPSTGLTKPEILERIMKYKKLAADVNWKEGACSGTVYSGEDQLAQLVAKVYEEFAWTNPLHADVFPDVRKMEAEVVRMTCNMFNGSGSSCGTMTTGGTESIMLACKAYRDLAYERGIKYPEMVIPVTAHAAFDKASQYFRIKVRHIAVDEQSRKVLVGRMRKAITRNTCMLVGSAPQFPHGVVDPITEIAKLGKRYNIPVHVDSCLGGFLVPFMKKAGFAIEPFDFSVPGVTSISADTHKYGFAPKGSSVIMYSDTFYRKYQYFVAPDWPGGIYASPTFSGSRAGAIIAACWATMMNIGESGYVESTRKIITTTRYIERELRKIPEVFVFGKPEVSVVAIGSHVFNVYLLLDALSQRGWKLNGLQYPSSLHLCVTLVHTKPGVADRFVNDVKTSVAELKQNPAPKSGGQAAIYGMAQSIPDRSLVSEIAGKFFDGYYSTTVAK